MTRIGLTTAFRRRRLGGPRQRGLEAAPAARDPSLSRPGPSALTRNSQLTRMTWTTHVAAVPIGRRRR